MNRLIGYMPIALLTLSIGCSSGGWCGNNQPAYPVGTYPLPGYPGAGYPGSGYPAGAVGQPGYPVAPNANGQQPPTLPYGTPIPSTYPQAGYPPGYPSGVYPQSQGVPLNSLSPAQPIFGR